MPSEKGPVYAHGAEMFDAASKDIDGDQPAQTESAGKLFSSPEHKVL